MPQLTKNTKLTVCKSAVVAGTTDITDASVIDMQDWEGVLFIAQFGVITAGAVTSLKAAQLATSSPTASTDDIAGSATSALDTDDDHAVTLDIYKPTYRYIRPWIDRGTQNAVLNSLIAIQYGPKKKPTTHDATTVPTNTALVSPAKGTA